MLKKHFLQLSMMSALAIASACCGKNDPKTQGDSGDSSLPDTPSANQLSINFSPTSTDGTSNAPSGATLVPKATLKSLSGSYSNCTTLNLPESWSWDSETQQTITLDANDTNCQMNVVSAVINTDAYGSKIYTSTTPTSITATSVSNGDYNFDVGGGANLTYSFAGSITSSTSSQLIVNLNFNLSHFTYSSNYSCDGSDSPIISSSNGKLFVAHCGYNNYNTNQSVVNNINDCLTKIDNSPGATAFVQYYQDYKFCYTGYDTGLISGSSNYITFSPIPVSQ